MLTFLCAFVLLYILVSIAWPSSGKKPTQSERQQQQESDRKHRELIAAIEKLERQQATPQPPPPRPTFGSAERARILALGRIRDGAKRHPILDAPFASVANPPKQEP